MAVKHDPAMIIHSNCVDGINEQIKNEFRASAQYTALSVYFDSEGLPALAAYFTRQSDEERMHALKFVKFLVEAGARPIIQGFADIRNEFKSAQEAVQCALDSELMVTRQINDLVGTAVKNNDYLTNTFLQWFVTEQLEEVSSMSQLLQIVKHAGSSLLLVEDHVRRLSATAAAAPAETAA